MLDIEHPSCRRMQHTVMVSAIFDPCIYWVFKGSDGQGFPYAHPAARRCVPKGRCLSCANAVLVAPVTRVPIICLKPGTRLAARSICSNGDCNVQSHTGRYRRVCSTTPKAV